MVFERKPGKKNQRKQKPFNPILETLNKNVFSRFLGNQTKTSTQKATSTSQTNMSNEREIIKQIT